MVEEEGAAVVVESDVCFFGGVGMIFVDGVMD